MVPTQLDGPRFEASWFRTDPSAPAIGWDAAAVRGVRQARRRRIVRVLGYVGLAGLGAVTAWMATSTPVREEIASWSTMGTETPVRLAASAPEDAAPSTPELDLAPGTIAWAVAPPLARSSVETTWIASTSALNDPYPGAFAPDAMSDPY